MLAGCGGGGQFAAPTSTPTTGLEGGEPGRQMIHAMDQSRTVAAQASLESDPDLAALGVKVTVSEGVATLTGTVESQDQKDRAAAIVGKVGGVTSVDNQIAVKGGGG